MTELCEVGGFPVVLKSENSAPVQSSNEIFVFEVKLIATEFLSLQMIDSGQFSNILKVPQNSCGGTCLD